MPREANAFMRFPWHPLVAALPIYNNKFFFVKKKFLEKELTKAKEMVTNDESNFRRTSVLKRSFSCSADHDITNKLYRIIVRECGNISCFVVKIVPGHLTIVSAVLTI
jgi:hypothetical protein